MKAQDVSVSAEPLRHWMHNRLIDQNAVTLCGQEPWEVYMADDKEHVTCPGCIDALAQEVEQRLLNESLLDPKRKNKNYLGPF